MANTLSAEKNARKAARRNKQRISVKSELKTLRKKTLVAAEEKKPAELVQELAKRAYKRLAQAAAHGYIHKNNASRKTGRLMKNLYKISQEKAQA
ncbi:30S ribosomal protein S20 [bacterium]|nr:30S ribosomal protein S20 [bacterium]